MCAHAPQRRSGGSSPNLHLLSCAVEASAGRKNVRLGLDDSMKAALKAVEDGQSVNGAARDYGIPKSTLFDRVSGRVIHGVKPGPRPYLIPREEGTLGHFLKH